MREIGVHLGDQLGVAAGTVVDDEIDLDFVLYGFIYDFCRVPRSFPDYHGLPDRLNAFLGKRRTALTGLFSLFAGK
jgi:hypothetical protein